MNPREKATRPRSGPRSAFTLMETIVALALLLVLVGSVFAFGMNLTASRERLNRHMRRSQAVRVFLDRLEQNLRTVVASDAKHGAGIEGREDSLVLLGRSVGAMGGQGGTAAAFGDLQRSEYRWNRSARSLEAACGPAGDSAAVHAIADDLGFVQWRYHDGTGWSSSFDSGSTRRLPVAIEVAIWFDPPPLDETASPAPPETDDAAAQDPFGLPLSAQPDRTSAGDEASGLEDELEDASRRNWPPPDRVRVIVVPDAPEFEYGRRFDDDADLPVPTDAPTEGGV